METELTSDSVEPSSESSESIFLYLSAVICNSTEGLTLADFLHTCTLNCQEKSDEFRESSKRMANECDVTSERYCNIPHNWLAFLSVS